MYRGRTGRRRGFNSQFGNRNESVNNNFNNFNNYGGQRVCYPQHYTQPYQQEQQKQRQHYQQQQQHYQPQQRQNHHRHQYQAKPVEAIRPPEKKEEEDRKAMVRSSDGDIIIIDVGAMAAESTLFKDMKNLNQLIENGIIKLPVSTIHLETIIKYAGYYKDIAVPSLNDKLQEYECGKFVSCWDFELFRDLSHPQIKKLQESAWLLGFQQFAALCHKKVAMDIKYYNQIKIRRVHDLYNDFTNEE